MKISNILDNIDMGALALPEFQRGYVWSRAQVRGLMHSLYRRHPVGGLLVWITPSDPSLARGDGQIQPGFISLLLDGQQRITSLYGIIRGTPPRFFDGNAGAFRDLHFNLEEERFEFYAPVKMRDDPLWVDVTEVLRDGTGAAMTRLTTSDVITSASDGVAVLQRYLTRLGQLDGVKDIELHVEQVTGEDKTVDVVVDIFNRVNSGGTKLSKGDLALARLCADWPEARDEMKRMLGKWSGAGFSFSLDWLLRNTNAVVTNRAEFSALAGVPVADFRAGLASAERAIDQLLNLVAGRLGLDHSRVLGGPGAFPLMTRYLYDRDLKLPAQREADALLYWYVHTFLWGRYAGSTETVLNQDLAANGDRQAATHRLIQVLAQTRGDLRVRPNDFIGWSRGARFYPLLYMLTRVNHARDWGTGIELRQHMLGFQASLEVHHIFPKAVLYQHGYSRPDVNAVANFTFLTKETNLRVSDRLPEEYIPELEGRNPGVVASHWIPMDPELWKVENYVAFLAKRRELLAEAANAFLDSLHGGQAPAPADTGSIFDRPGPAPVFDDDEEATIRGIQSWVAENGLARGAEAYELVDADTGMQEAVLDVAWPDGLQPGLSEPVAVLLNEEAQVEAAAGRFGYRFFTSAEDFIAYVRAHVIDEDVEAA